MMEDSRWEMQMAVAGTFTEVMVHKEVSVLRCLHSMLEHEAITTRDQFADLMCAAFTHGRLEPKKLSEDLGFNFSTVYRWIEGSSAPHRSLWPRVVAWVMTEIDERIVQYEKKRPRLLVADV